MPEILRIDGSVTSLFMYLEFSILCRDEVESVINEEYGEKYLIKKKIDKQIRDIDREVRKLKSKLTSLEKEKKNLMESVKNI